MNNGGCLFFLNWREINMNSVFVRLKVTSQVAPHCVILPRSVLIQAAAVAGSSSIIKRLVSSAKRQMFDPISRTMSLLYSKNNRDPKIEP